MFLISDLLSSKSTKHDHHGMLWSNQHELPWLQPAINSLLAQRSLLRKQKCKRKNSCFGKVSNWIFFRDQNNAKAQKRSLWIHSSLWGVRKLLAISREKLQLYIESSTTSTNSYLCLGNMHLIWNERGQKLISIKVSLINRRGSRDCRLHLRVFKKIIGVLWWIYEWFF